LAELRQCTELSQYPDNNDGDDDKNNNNPIQYYLFACQLNSPWANYRVSKSEEKETYAK
jgi:hypothetical protein